jgi:hypothetical protein
MNNNELTTDKMISGLAGLALVTIGIKNLKNPYLLTGLAVASGVYMLFNSVKTLLPESEVVEDYLDDSFTTEREPDYI